MYGQSRSEKPSASLGEVGIISAGRGTARDSTRGLFTKMTAPFSIYSVEFSLNPSNFKYSQVDIQHITPSVPLIITDLNYQEQTHHLSARSTQDLP